VTWEGQGRSPEVTIHSMHCDPDIENDNLLLRMVRGVYDPVVFHADPVEMLCSA